jgi:hypothetical protein
VAPFVGLFGSPRAGGGVPELHSMIAPVVYSLLAWLLFGGTRSAAITTSTSVERRNEPCREAEPP